MAEAILDLGAARRQHDGILHRPVEEGVGLPNYQTLTNWMRRHGVET